MYFATLAELEAIMQGHLVAYLQLGLQPEPGVQFNNAFSSWLHEQEGTSGASAGWAYSVRELATRRNMNAEALFSELVDEFFIWWLPSVQD